MSGSWRSGGGKGSVYSREYSGGGSYGLGGEGVSGGGGGVGGEGGGSGFGVGGFA
jgi:hypothetical protein